MGKMYKVLPLFLFILPIDIWQFLWYNRPPAHNCVWAVFCQEVKFTKFSIKFCATCTTIIFPKMLDFWIAL